MTELFDDKWIRKHGEKPPEVWMSMLAKMTPEQVQTGIWSAMEKAVNDFRGTGASWPPSLPEFIAMCTPPPEKTFQEYKMLPTPQADPEKAKAAIAGIREAIRGKLA